MPKPTQADLLEEGLRALGCKFDSTKSWGSRYQWYLTNPLRKDPRNHKPLYYFVGPNGALRCGTAPSKSFACHDTFRLKVLEAQPKRLEALGQALMGDL